MHAQSPFAFSIFLYRRSGEGAAFASDMSLRWPSRRPFMLNAKHVSALPFYWLCSDVPVLVTKNVVPGGFLCLWGWLAMWYVLILCLKLYGWHLPCVCFGGYNALGRDTTLWAARRHLSAGGAWKTKTQELRHLSCVRALCIHSEIEIQPTIRFHSEITTIFMQHLVQGLLLSKLNYTLLQL